MIKLLPFALLIFGSIYWLFSSRRNSELTAGQRSRRRGFKVLFCLLALPVVLTVLLAGVRFASHSRVHESATIVHQQRAADLYQSNLRERQDYESRKKIKLEHGDVLASQLSHLATNGLKELAKLNQRNHDQVYKVEKDYADKKANLKSEKAKLEAGPKELAEERLQKLNVLKNKQIGDPATVQNMLRSIEQSYESKVRGLESKKRGFEAKWQQNDRHYEARLQSAIREHEGHLSVFRQQYERQVEQYQHILTQLGTSDFSSVLPSLTDSDKFDAEMGHLKEFKETLKDTSESLLPLAFKLEALMRQFKSKTPADEIEVVVATAQKLQYLDRPLVAPLPSEVVGSNGLAAMKQVKRVKEVVAVVTESDSVTDANKEQTLAAINQANAIAGEIEQNIAEVKNAEKKSEEEASKNSEGKEGELPAWAAVDPNVLRVTNDVTEVLLVSKQFSTVEEAEQQLRKSAGSMILRSYLEKNNQAAVRDWSIPEDVVKRHLNGRRHVEAIDRQSGATQFRVYRVYQELAMTPQLFKDVGPHIKTVVLDDRIRTFVTIALSIIVLIGTIFGYLQIDTNTVGAYRWRLRGAALVFCLGAMWLTLVVAANLPLSRL